MFGRVVVGSIMWLVCIPVHAQVATTDTNDPKSLWGQDTEAMIGKIEKRLTDLQIQSDTATMTQGAEFFIFSGYDTDTQTLTPISRLYEDGLSVGLNVSDQVILTDDGTGLDPNIYLPKLDDGLVMMTTPSFADDDIQKDPTLATRLYDRIVNDGAGSTARLKARIFLNETPTTPTPSLSDTHESVASDPEILVSINAPDWRQDDSAMPKTSSDAKLKKINPKDEPFKNIKSALENISVESTPSFSIAVPRLREVIVDAMRAVGYYDVEFHLKNAGGGTIDVIIDRLGDPVKLASHTLDVRGQLYKLPEVQTLINQSPKVDDVFHQGVYEHTKTSIDELSAQKGFFDGEWLEHSAEVLLPDNLADVNLIYNANQRYVFDDVVFFTVDKTSGQLTTDPDKLPIKPELLQKLLTFETGDGFDSKKVTQLSNELLATRYFNAINVETVLPNNDTSEGASIRFENEIKTVVLDEEEAISASISPIEFGVSDDLLVKLNSVSAKANRLYNSPDDRVLDKKAKNATSLLAKLSDGIKSIARAILPDESGDELPELPADLSNRPTLSGRKSSEQVFADKKVPLYVFVASDKPKDAQIGLGWGSDTGMRAMTRLENNLINKDGYQAGVELSISEINKGANVFVSRPWRHPINDKLVANIKYFEEEIAQSVDNVRISSRSVESGLSRNIVKPTGWNRTFSLRYRLDDLETNAPRHLWENLPVQFHTGRTTQEAVLVGASLSKTISDNLISPTRGYRQYYSLELGSKGVISDTDMAIAKVGVSGMASFGDNLYGKDRAHQLIGRLDLGYIWANEFNGVPYKLRFFAGGDQSIRGYDYQSLSPHNRQGYLIGGQALAVGSLEYNYEIKEGLRTAVFADVGGAYDKAFSDKAFGQDTKLGVGVGVRFASPVGMVRVDIAKGIEDTKTPIRLHFLIGKPF